MNLTMEEVTNNAAEEMNLSKNDKLEVLLETKTPMTIINELSRYNKINAQYILLDESGPAHHKTYKVRLKLGESEEFVNTGLSIKKAQQATALKACYDTNFPFHPGYKPNDSTDTILPKTEKYNLRTHHSPSFKPTKKAPPHRDLRQSIADKHGPNSGPFNLLKDVANKLRLPLQYDFNKLPKQWNYSVSPVHPYYGEPLVPDPPMVHPLHMNPLGYNIPTNLPCQLISVPSMVPHISTSSLHSQFVVSLTVGSHAFTAAGNTKSAALHSAASSALRALHYLRPSANEDLLISTDPNQQSDASATQEPESCKPAVPQSEVNNDLNKVDHSSGLVATEPSSDTHPADPSVTYRDEMREVKSDVSIIYEIAAKKKLDVNFELMSRVGSPHDPIFEMKCEMGEWAALGQGQNKKLAKQDAATNLLHCVAKDLTWATCMSLATSVTQPDKAKVPDNKKKVRTEMKRHKGETNYGQLVNPISRLMQVQQARRLDNIVYTLMEERSGTKRSEFVYECRIGDQVTNGMAPNKRLAKRCAAEEMLQKLGYGRAFKEPSKPVLKYRIDAPNEDESSDSNEDVEDKQKPSRRVTFNSKCKIRPIAKITSGLADPAVVSGQYEEVITSLRGLAIFPENHSMRRGSLSPYQVASEFISMGYSPSLDAISPASSFAYSSDRNDDADESLPDNDISQIEARVLSEACSYLKRICSAFNLSIDYTDMLQSPSSGYFSLVTVSGLPENKESVFDSGDGKTSQQAKNNAAFAVLQKLANQNLVSDAE